MNWLNAYSKEKSITKREVIERAVLFYKESVIKDEMAISFKKASVDLEVLDMAEEGLEDYNNQLKKSDLGDKEIFILLI
ncbi:MAG: hypothetical protein WC285_02475 [Candidatus Gracilibacteria bacterium]